jgi:hypothetical protein
MDRSPPLRYGVFNLGQIWTVVCDDGQKLGFPSRALAIAAAEDMLALHRSYGSDVEMVVQDELGGVRVFQSGPSTEQGRP